MKKNNRFGLLLSFHILIFSLVLLAGCGGGSTGMRDYLNDPNYPQDFWTTGTPEEVGLDTQTLIDCTNISSGIHSMLVIRNDKLVFERYGRDTQGSGNQITPADTYNIYSVTKSFTSSLIGIALSEGYIHSLRDPILPYFPDFTPRNMSESKARITVEDVLTMRTGLSMNDESDTWALTDGYSLVNVLDKPMITEPGTVFSYASGNTQILAYMIYKTTGNPPEAYAREKLFTPLGITRYQWETDGVGVNLGGLRLYLTPRDMAKFGYLYLKRGVWNGAQVVPSSWVTVSTKMHATTGDVFDYGYQWWTYPPGGFQAIGWGGQRIIVFPDKNLIIVFTSYLPQNSVLDTITQRILQSVES